MARPAPDGAPARWDLLPERNTLTYDDAYWRLGLSPGADVQTVKSAFRRLARHAHPDCSDDPDAASTFASIRRAYEQLQAEGEPSGSQTSSGIALTVEFAGVDSTVTFLTPGPDGSVLTGSSDGPVSHIDDTGHLRAARVVVGDGLVRAARRPDGTCGAAACGNALLFALDGRVVYTASSLREPRRMTMCGNDLVWWNGNQIELIDPCGDVRWSASFAKPVTHVTASGDRLLCVAGRLAVFRRPRAED